MVVVNTAVCYLCLTQDKNQQEVIWSHVFIAFSDWSVADFLLNFKCKAIVLWWMCCLYIEESYCMRV